jgi:Ser/Thr protein kinase RdoA (MazF antagonist)
MHASGRWHQPDQAERQRLIREALAAYDCAPIAEAVPVAGSVRNENYRVETDRGPRFVRFHRPSRTLVRLRREHRVIEWAGRQGLPAVRPLVSRHGDTLLELAGRLVAVFPWVDGGHLQRTKLTAAQAFAMGDMHGRVHAVLARYADADLPWFWFTWGPVTEHTAARLGAFAELLPSATLTEPERGLIGQVIETQRDYLAHEEHEPVVNPRMTGVQPVHGDFHERNLLLDDDGRVVAVVDWDQTCLMPRGFEIVRALCFAELLDPPLLDAYLAAYHEHAQLLPEECAVAVELWWQFVVRSTWLYDARLRECDPAVQPFFTESLIHLARFGDRAFRMHLAGELQRLAGSPS